ncbi:SDR family NAD(P)-dependent oxidoreductase [Tomitella gaofuii]|uniref:SDR family NAD(P)-dependent oxidoreductase n=1 Tax=Tomitella gaofuii TaxID=2760083 RepID=UPI0015FE089C|nr:glucose 1-dehydrogenase [Tomitella gaofuii]
MTDTVDRARLETMFDLTGRTAIITGGTRGIGLSIAEAYVAAGANVVVASRKPEACEAAQRHLRELGGAALGVPTHLGDLDGLQALVDLAADEFGGVDIVVNDAANPLAQPLGEQTADAWQKSFEVNVRGPVFLVQAALPHLEASAHAAVVNVVSIGAFMFSPKVSIYAAAKSALTSVTRSMAAAYAPKGIRVNALAPGSVNTHMVRQNTPESIKAMADMSLLGRIATPDELTGPALLLASDAGSFITGQVLVVDGGSVAY